MVQPTQRGPDSAVRKPPPVQADPLQQLLDAHAQLRIACALAQRVASIGGPPEVISGAAQQLVRYFGDLLPLHEEDEDFSLTPLITHAAPDAGRVAVEQMVRAHAALEPYRASLLGRWRALAERPQSTVARFRLQADTQRLCALVNAHLDHEEQVVFPLARRVLRPFELERLREEMRARRGAN